MANMRKIEAETLRAQADAQLKMAQVGQAQLNTAEQATGVKQERDLQRQGAQAEANLGLEVGKTLLANTTQEMKNSQKNGEAS